MSSFKSKQQAKRRTLGILSAFTLGALGSALPSAVSAQSKGVLRIGYQKYGTLTLLNRSYAEKHGSTLQLLFEELTKSDHLVKSKQQEAVRIVAESTGLDREIVDVYLSCRPRSPVVHLTEGSEVVALVKASEVSLAKL